VCQAPRLAKRRKRELQMPSGPEVVSVLAKTSREQVLVTAAKRLPEARTRNRRASRYSPRSAPKFPPSMKRISPYKGDPGSHCGSNSSIAGHKSSTGR
jgi:hypothetical protein